MSGATGFWPFKHYHKHFANGSPAASQAVANARAALAGKTQASASIYADRSLVYGDSIASPSEYVASLAASSRIDDDGWLDANSQFVIAGDIATTSGKDWESPINRAQLLAWHAAHGEQQVCLLLGAHHLERMRLGSHSRVSQELARQIATSTLKLPVGVPRRRVWEEWRARTMNGPDPLAVFQYGVTPRAESKLIRRLLLEKRFLLAVVRRDRTDGRPLLITHSGVTVPVARAIGVSGDPYHICDALNAALNEAVDAVRSDWIAGKNTDLNLGRLYQPWGILHGAGGMLAQRPRINAINRTSCNDLGIDEPEGGTLVPAQHYGFLRFSQVAGHTRPDFPSLDSEPTLDGFGRPGDYALSIDSELGSRLQCVTARIASVPEQRTCFFIAGPQMCHRAMREGLHRLEVEPSDPRGRWSEHRPNPKDRIADAEDGLLSILAADYPPSDLAVIDRFLADCLERRSIRERHRMGSLDCTMPGLEDLHHWVRVMLGRPEHSAASRLAERWLTLYRSSRDGIQRLYPPVDVQNADEL